MNNNRRHIYMDHGASTPVDPQVIEAMLPYWTETYGNPASTHHYGRQAARGLEAARRTIAGLNSRATTREITRADLSLLLPVFL